MALSPTVKFCRNPHLFSQYLNTGRDQAHYYIPSIQATANIFRQLLLAPQQLLALILHGSSILFLFHSNVISKFDKMLRGLRSEFGAPSSVLCFQEFSHPVPNLMATFYSTEARKMQSSSQVLCIQLTGVGSA